MFESMVLKWKPMINHIHSSLFICEWLIFHSFHFHVIRLMAVNVPCSCVTVKQPSVWPSQGEMKASRQAGSPVGDGRRQIMCRWGGNQETLYIILKWSSALCLSGGFWRNLHKCTYNPEVQSYIQIIQTACSQEESVGCELINLNLFVYRLPPCAAVFYHEVEILTLF